jgi:hypothetical protein
MDPFPLRRLRLQISDKVATIFGHKGDAAAHDNTADTEKICLPAQNP